MQTKIIDVLTFNGEYDLLDLHLNILRDHVDEFIICEAPLTFTGKPKPLYFQTVQEKYKDFNIKYYVIDENDEELWTMARNSPNTNGAEHWKREFVHKESIKKALTHLQDDDICFIGDVDEIFDPIMVHIKPKEMRKLKLDVYTYYLNNRSSEQFHGTIIGYYKDIKNECLNHLRTNTKKSVIPGGWHFTSMGGLDTLKKKLGDQYTEDSYWNKEVQEKLESRFGHTDFLGRGFTYILDEEGWPQYLKDNKEKYAHLIR